jgi:DNA invertase Pin-like site-specific DNA recombinase
MSEKITVQHKERVAVVYVRQSSLTQVKHHLESQRRQYGLKDHALTLGFRSTEVIDDDLGRSGSGLVERPGFGRLLERICSGEIGAVLALEASRLARNNRDWHHLVDLCAMTGTLVIDYDGIYDARVLNDRLLLGLKGTMSEFELGLLRQRAQEALRQKIARGEVLYLPPMGYVRTEHNQMEMVADAQVQQAVHGVFARFEQTGSARQVLLWYRQEGIQLPTYTADGQLVWRLPVFQRIIHFLKNPTYAGAFVYGRRTTRVEIRDGRQKRSAGHPKPESDWSVVILGHHPAYISWEQYRANQRVLRDNAAMRGKMRTAVKSGAALLSGLMRCGHCGRALRVYYSGSSGVVRRYHCVGAQINHGAARCIGIGALKVDEMVVRTVLEALQPSAFGAVVAAENLAASQRRQRIEAMELAVAKARYEADRCRRQYEAVEPENRLVAAELEGRWNAALVEAKRLEAAQVECEASSLPLSELEARELKAIGADIVRAWAHPAVTPEIKKRILRTVIEEVIVRIENTPSRATAHLTLHWAGGAHTALSFPKNRPGNHGRTTHRDTVELVRKLVSLSPDGHVAAVLNHGGHRTGAGLAWTAERVAFVRRNLNLPACRGDRSWWTMQQAAKHLNVSAHVVRKLIKMKILPAEQVVAHAPWLIAPESLRIPAVVQAVIDLRNCGHIKLQHADDTLDLPLHDEQP